MICPNCSQNRAHRSHRGFKDWLLSLLALKPYRCHNCKHRFYAYKSGAVSEKLRTSEERRIMKLRRSIKWKRRRGELILFGISSLVFLAILFYIIQQRVAPGE
jgi:hypothetical protein